MKQILTLNWISIGVALASAVGIYFVPNHSYLFLALLIANIVLALFCGFARYYKRKKDIGITSTETKPSALLTVCRILVGALFIFSSFTKGVDPLGTKYKILDYLAVYHMTWLNEAAMVLAMGLILLEFLVGICLITNIFPRLSVLGATLLMLFFTCTTLFDAKYDLVPDCGCFGTAVKMSNWQTFYKNLVIDAILIPLIINNKELKNRLNWRWQLAIGFAYALLFFGFEMYNYRHLPVFEFGTLKRWKVGTQLNQPKSELRFYVTYKNKTTGETKEYLSSEIPWRDTVWSKQWEFYDRREEGGEDLLGFSAFDDDNVDVTEDLLTTPNLLMFTSHDLTKITEKEWDKAQAITEAALQHGYTVIWTVGNDHETAGVIRKGRDFIDEMYYGDELEIKTVVRFNPGLIWLDNGFIKDKWSAVDFPQGKKLEKLFE